MSKPDGAVESSAEEEARWGTWEELLLAFAVNRYGTKSWDSVAIELQKRTTAPARSLSPHNCRLKYLHLKRRYSDTSSNKCNGNVNVNDDEDKEKNECLSLLEELRKLRVAELRREVERYDLSIVSLQLKKQRLEEERERSLQETENGESKLDLAKNKGTEANNERCEETEFGFKPEERSSPELVASVEALEEASDKDQQSVNESSFTDSKCSCSLETSAEYHEIKTKQVRTGIVMTKPLLTGSIKEEPDKCAEKNPVREDSYNGSSESVENPPVGVSMKVEPVSESPKLVESVAESKGGEEGTKENSDVQSSASKPKKNMDDKLLRGCSSGDEREKENRSSAVKEIPVESQSLIAFLEKIRSHMLGRMFERRLESQEAENYSNLVRQHVDLETVWTWLENGHYLSCKSKFFRDLMLLVSNAIIFFKKNSLEFVAATELRQLILKEISQTKDKSDSSFWKQTSLKSASLSKKEITKPSDSLLLKTNISESMIVCRKRSSITAKADASASGGDTWREKTILYPLEKVVVDMLQQPTQLDTNAGKNRITKKRTRDRFASGSASLKKNDKSCPNTTYIKNSTAVVDKNQGEGESSSQHQQSKSESRNMQSNMYVKKRSATNVNRMKKNTSSNSDLLLDALKSRPLSSDSKGGSEQKKNESGTSGGRKEPASSKTYQGKESASSKSPEAKQAKEKGSPMKKNVGRPPKRGAADPSPSSKRSWEGAESVAITQKQPRKRSRR